MRCNSNHIYRSLPSKYANIKQPLYLGQCLLMLVIMKELMLENILYKKFTTRWEEEETTPTLTFRDDNNAVNSREMS